jgi:hypothetical protein
MGKPVSLSNGRSWRFQKDAFAHFREMLSRYEDGDRISVPSDESDLRALLKRYDAEVPSGQPTKTGVGVSHFSRELNTGDTWATSSFHVHRVDGTSTDFSFYEAVRVKEF